MKTKRFSFFWANGKPPRYPLLVLARCMPRQKLTTTIAFALSAKYSQYLN
ncbi:hypothetical protein JCM19274_1061 [Algibacter lectus]|uniref:Uncharacterized protein n=1 Tax=Algibacter lectus TaxID=221126 RepID=A0A090X4Y6_9FLAO|nr:hypothetical protein JCM19274_1061 [Algibacter lectus]